MKRGGDRSPQAQRRVQKSCDRPPFPSAYVLFRQRSTRTLGTATMASELWKLLREKPTVKCVYGSHASHNSIHVCTSPHAQECPSLPITNLQTTCLGPILCLFLVTEPSLLPGALTKSRHIACRRDVSPKRFPNRQVPCLASTHA